MASPHVLVMDDIAEVLDLLRQILHEEGYRVSPRPTVVGLDEVKRLAPDVILLDLVCGGQHRGLDLLQQLRHDRTTADVPVVVCSAAVDAVRIMFEGHDKGWQFLTLSRLDREFCRVPIILCTAAVRTVREMADHLAAQNVGVVLKPFDIDQLLREIDARLVDPMLRRQGIRRRRRGSCVRTSSVNGVLRDRAWSSR